MRFRTVLLAILGLALWAPDGFLAQPGYMRRPAVKEKKETKKETRKERKRRRRRSRRKKKAQKLPPKSLVTQSPEASKQMIEAYLQTRLNALESKHKSQAIYGRRMSARWTCWMAGSRPRTRWLASRPPLLSRHSTQRTRGHGRSWLTSSSTETSKPSRASQRPWVP